MKKMLLFLLLYTAVISLKAQTTYFVKTDGDAGNSGADWANAKTLAAAITSATSGDMIFVMKGTYTATSGQPLINLTSTKNGIKLYGGFAGTETNLAQRVFGTTAADSTNFVGNGARVINNSGTIGSPINNIIYDGFTVKNGGGSAVGAGMNNGYASVTVSNCIFIGNTASGNAGGMYNNVNTVIITDCKFYANTSGGNGGGLLISGGSNATVTNCTFDGNITSSYGGGIATYDASNSTTITISNCTFTRNESTTSNGGGGLANDNASPLVINCTFKGNKAPSGGGIWNRSTTASAKFVNCLITGNKATNAGGGVYNINQAGKDCIPTMVNCTIASNNATNNGGAMWNTGATGTQVTNPAITNCIIYGNNHGIGNSVAAGVNATATVTYSNVQYAGVNANEVDYSASTGNLNVNPLFTNSPANSGAPFLTGDFTLQSTSPAINVGNNSAISGYSTDLLNNPRIYNSVTVDMGAYEYQGTLPVTLVSFVGKLSNKQVRLNWITAAEQNNSHFNILRSFNGKNFEYIGKITGNGTTNIAKNYEFTDESPLGGTNYYKLEQVDFDGKKTLSRAIYVVVDLQKTQFSVFTTINTQELNINIGSIKNQKGTISIVNISGQKIGQIPVNLEKGQNSFSIPAALQKGTYVATLVTADEKISVKFIN